MAGGRTRRLDRRRLAAEDDRLFLFSSQSFRAVVRLVDVNEVDSGAYGAGFTQSSLWVYFDSQINWVLRTL